MRVAVVAFMRGPKSNKAALSSPVRRIRMEDVIHQCTKCNDSFPSKQQLAVHSFKELGVRPRLRPYMTGRTCERCLLMFGNRLQPHNHCANRTAKCGDWYIEHCVPADTFTVADDIDEDRQLVAANLSNGMPRHFSGIPCGQLEGHLPFGAPERDPSRPHRSFATNACIRE